MKKKYSDINEKVSSLANIDAISLIKYTIFIGLHGRGFSFQNDPQN